MTTGTDNQRMKNQLDIFDLKKTLAERADVYEAAPEPCKGSLGLFLKRLFADVQAKQVEHQMKKVG